jgi:hypothetical protein
MKARFPMWAQLINTFVGIWLMFAPDALGYDGPAATNAHIVGPLVASFACIAVFEVTRPVRWWNVPLGLWLVLAPWVLPDYPPVAMVNDMVVGVVVVSLSLVRGRIRGQYGGGWSVLWKSARRPTSPTSS